MAHAEVSHHHFEEVRLARHELRQLRADNMQRAIHRSLFADAVEIDSHFFVAEKLLVLANDIDLVADGWKEIALAEELPQPRQRGVRAQEQVVVDLPLDVAEVFGWQE